MSVFEIEVVRRHGAAVLLLRGDVDDEAIDRAHEVLTDLLEDETNRLVSVEFADGDTTSGTAPMP